MNSYNVKINNINEMSSFVEKISKEIKDTDLVCFFGDLGAGKTFIAKKIISKLCKIDENDISSPTFSVVNEYKYSGKTVLHCDLYRIEDVSEIEELGILDQIGKNLVICEWPEILFQKYGNLLQNCIKIEIKTSKSSTDGREISVLVS